MSNWLSEDEMALWRPFLTAILGVSVHLDSSLRAASDLSLDDYEVLVHLSEADGRRLRMSQLSDRLLNSRSRLTQRIDRLARRGYVTRKKCDADRRGTWAVLTDTGFAALVEAAPFHVAHVREVFFDHLETSDLDALTEIFRRLATQFDPDLDS